MNYLDKEIFNRISNLEVDCPDCEHVFGDDQYTCTTCWSQGGEGKLNVIEFLMSTEWHYND